MTTKKGQITIFIIIAILIVAGVALLFIFRENIFGTRIPSTFEPVYNYFLSCVEDNAITGVSILGSQGGYIELPDFEPGSSHMPFSSQLLFLGNPIPYWYYISGNNIEKEQIPSKRNMETQLADFVESRIQNCVFEQYYDEGYEINFGSANVDVSISVNSVKVGVDMDLSMTKSDENVLIKSHNVVVNSNLGSLYESAKKIYEKQQDELFLENYGVDILRNYAPVDGVEISCAPITWQAPEVFDDLREAIEINTLALNADNDEKYFDLNLPVRENVRFITSQNWPTSLEVAPSEENILISEPIGNQEGLGILGFCFVPYHFVYDMKYPVLIQIESGEEFFQFPMAVVIQGNQPRESLQGSSILTDSSEVCEYKNTLVTIQTYDNDLNPIESEVSYECFGEKCFIGETSGGSLTDNFPQCVNGYILAKSEGFKDSRYLFSTAGGGSAGIILDRLYDLKVDLKLDGESYLETAMIYFVSDGLSKTLVYPEQKSVELSEGNYEIIVYIYRESSITLGESFKEQCFNVAGTGLFGGLTQERCVEMPVFEQTISQVLGGGGKGDYYALDSSLRVSNTIEINAQGLPLPETIEQLQDNHLLFEDKTLEVSLK